MGHGTSSHRAAALELRYPPRVYSAYVTRRTDERVRPDKALEAVALGLLDEHLERCVMEAVPEGGQVADDKVAEASAAIARLVKS